MYFWISGARRLRYITWVTLAGEMSSNRAVSLYSYPEGVVAELGSLGPGAIITEAGLARMMNRHPKSIKRAVARGELPQPCRLLGQPVWTVGAIIQHIENRLERAAQKAEKEERRFSRLSP